MGEVHQLKSRAQPGEPCPICGKPAQAPSQPFCSTRCAHLDLGRWLDGSYRVPTAEGPDEPDKPDPE